MRTLVVTWLFVILITNVISAQDIVDVVEQGISDGIQSSKQQDRDEAILDAKLKAIEKAGVNIEVVTTMENFQMKKDWVEQKAKAYLLPGFQIIETGYGQDRLYHVVLVGKISLEVKQMDNYIGDSDLERQYKFIHLIFEKPETRYRGQQSASEFIEKYPNSEWIDDILLDLLHYSDSYSGATEYYLKLKSYFPNSKLLGQAEQYYRQWSYLSKLGIKSFRIDPLLGLKVIEIEESSPASGKIFPGDIIKRINNEIIISEKNLENIADELINTSDPIWLFIHRNGVPCSMFITIEP